ncbi:MAG TPA: ParB/RepB/Spo0J family partition protein [Gemmatimonadales bacterium]|nr:ParB/RepB/Spo0J family partition protein [Gemmatimonadales bacterium]
MKWLGYQQKSVKSLHLPGEIGKRQKQQHVIDLAADIRELGEEPINAPVFDKAGQIIAGRDRMAALLINKAKRVWIRVADATDQERADLEVSENLYRRVDNRDEMIARRVHRVVEKVAAEKAAIGSRRAEAVTRQDVVAARKAVARQLNTTPKAIKSAEQRAAAKAKDIPSGSAAHPAATDEVNHTEAARGGEAAVTLAPPDPPCPVDAFGIETSPAFRSRMSEIQGVLEVVNHHLVRAQTELAKLKGAPDFNGAVWQRLKAELHSTAYNARAAKPALVCPYCRDPEGTAMLRDNCNGCGGRGYLVEEQRASVPRELLTRGAKPVTVATSRRKATITLLDGDNNPIDVTKEDPPSLPLPLEPVDDTEADEDRF